MGYIVYYEIWRCRRYWVAYYVLSLCRRKSSCCLSKWMYNTGQKINSPEFLVSVRSPSGVCGQELNFGPIFTKFGTQLSRNIPKMGVFRVSDQICNFTSLNYFCNPLLTHYLGHTDYIIGYFVGRHWTDFAFVRTLSCLHVMWILPMPRIQTRKITHEK